jgi:hypothetical protein
MGSRLAPVVVAAAKVEVSLSVPVAKWHPEQADDLASGVVVAASAGRGPVSEQGSGELSLQRLLVLCVEQVFHDAPQIEL